MLFSLTNPARNRRETPTPSSPQIAQQLLSAADQARDDWRWHDAAELYGQYLAIRCADAAIWVQLGHALKESGNFVEAESAYHRSIELAPNVADTQLQLGHLYKKMRYSSNAIAAYREALRIDETLLDARRELVHLGVAADEIFSSQASALLRKPTTFIDLSDVLSYLHHHPTVSGIQRVQLGIANAIIAMRSKERSGILFLSDAGDQNEYMIIDDVLITELSRELSRDNVVHSRLIDVMGNAISLGRPYEPVAGDTLLLVGAFWVLENIVERAILLKHHGIRIGTVIHDLIPITHPEYCERSLTEAFKACVFRVLSLTDFILTLSDHSGRNVRNFMAKYNIPEVPTRTLRSAHKSWDTSNRGAALSPEVARLIKEDYVLYVSTIEIRKNHTYLFRIWKRLIDRFDKKTPLLVFVGRPGWRVQDLMDQLTSTSNLDGNIRILHDLSDIDLTALYRSALFTVFPSFEEGWGLPVGESLIFGRPCIASNTSSVPEVAGDFVDYIDPLNEHDGYQKILQFVEDRELLEQRARHIKENFKPREWNHVARDMIEIVQSLLDGLDIPDRSVETPRVVPGRVYHLGHRDDASRFLESGDSEFSHFACDTGWGRVEQFGRWIRDRTARLEFLTKQIANEPVMVLLEIFTVDWLGPMQLRISVNETDYPLMPLEPGVRRFLVLHVVPHGERVALEFSGVGDIRPGSDERKYLWLGLASVGYAPNTDALSRVMLLEELLSSVSNIVTLQPTRVS
jgi:glycosyltransferase involved in cell wall biosynthesis